jgi:hypothetical protein
MTVSDYLSISHFNWYIKIFIIAVEIPASFIGIFFSSLADSLNESLNLLSFLTLLILSANVHAAFFVTLSGMFNNAPPSFKFKNVGHASEFLAKFSMFSIVSLNRFSAPSFISSLSSKSFRSFLSPVFLKF